MAVMVVMALGLGFFTLLDRSSLGPGERSACLMLAGAAMLMIFAQWGLAGVRRHGDDASPSVFCGVLAMLLAILAVVCVAILLVALPDAAVVVMGMLLVFVLQLASRA